MEQGQDLSPTPQEPVKLQHRRPIRRLKANKPRRAKRKPGRAKRGKQIARPTPMQIRRLQERRATAITRPRTTEIQGCLAILPRNPPRLLRIRRRKRQSKALLHQHLSRALPPQRRPRVSSRMALRQPFSQRNTRTWRFFKQGIGLRSDRRSSARQQVNQRRGMQLWR
jgi:hypothetical protein